MFEMKGNKARILLVAILSMLFAIFGIYSFKSWATGAGGSANTNITYVDPATTATFTGKQESFYLSAGLSGAAGTYTTKSPGCIRLFHHQECFCNMGCNTLEDKGYI